MGLSYNPSSFATNKTILEAIEELKRYLIANPLACIYELNDDALGGGPYALSSIVNPNAQEIKLGDIVLSTDGFYGFIQTIGTTDFTVVWYELSAKIDSVSVSDTTGAWQTIPAGANVIFRLNPDDLNPLRYKRANGYQIDLQYSDINGTHNQTYNVGTQIVSAIWSIEDPITHDTTIYIDVLDNEGTSTINTMVIPAGATGQNGADGVSITGATIDASNHLILTLSDGNTIDAGALPTPSEYTHTVTISTTSGTFTDDEFAKLGYGDSVIIYDDGTIKTAYKLKIETASILEFECIDATSKNNLKLIDVNKTTKAYSMTSVAMIKSATFDSGTATAGKVLTANGSGGTSWEDAGGGTLTRYDLSLTATNMNTDTVRERVLNIINNAKKVIVGLAYVHENGTVYIPLAISEGFGSSYVELSGIGTYWFNDQRLIFAYIRFRKIAYDTNKAYAFGNFANVGDPLQLTRSTDAISGSSLLKISYWNETEILS